MKKLLDNITAEVTNAFVEAGYEEKFGKVTLSNRPDLCEFQCNGAMAAAKQYKKAPFMIADDVAARLQDVELFASVESVKPGFLNESQKKELKEAYRKASQPHPAAVPLDWMETKTPEKWQTYAGRREYNF